MSGWCMSGRRWGKASWSSPPTYWESWMELRGKDLSARLASTLKEEAERSWGPRYSAAAATMASLSFSQARARVRPATPNSRFMASQAPSKSQSSDRGST